MAAVLGGFVAYILYPDIKFCFLVIGASALLAVFFTQYLPHGDQAMGRGFLQDQPESQEGTNGGGGKLAVDINSNTHTAPEAASYAEVFLSKETVLICFTGFFFQ